MRFGTAGIAGDSTAKQVFGFGEGSAVGLDDGKMLQSRQIAGLARQHRAEKLLRLGNPASLMQRDRLGQRR